MQTASSARRTCFKSLSEVEYTATVLMSSSLHALKIRRAISPRLAIRIFFILFRLCSNYIFKYGRFI